MQAESLELPMQAGKRSAGHPIKLGQQRRAEGLGGCGAAARRAGLGQICQHAPALLPRRRAYRQQSLHEKGALLALRSQARAPPQHRVPQGPLGTVVGRLQACHLRQRHNAASCRSSSQLSVRALAV